MLQVDLSNYTLSNDESLVTLSEHRLEALNVHGLSIANNSPEASAMVMRNHITTCLGHVDTQVSLKLLDIGAIPSLCHKFPNITRSVGGGSGRLSHTANISWIVGYTNLQSLTVSEMPFNNEMLAIICQYLPGLRSLDITRTAVTCISPLLSLRCSRNRFFKLPNTFIDVCYS